MEFKCKCGSTKLEEVMYNVTTISEITTIELDESGEIDIQYGEQTNEDGTVDHYQCANCGNHIAYNQDDLRQALLYEDA